MAARAQSRGENGLSIDPAHSAAMAGLRYVDVSTRGVRRIRCGSGFRYVGVNGTTIKDPITIRRIRSLVIPPAWSNVWICPTADGHIQAVGWDARGRKQYRYHPLYRHVRDEAKFGRMIAFGAVLALIRKRVAEDLGKPGLAREKVLAAVVHLLETTSIRVGNEEYARDNDSFGLTTLRNRHARVDGSKVRFEFKGKSGQEHSVELTNRRLAKVIERCRDLPGDVLFSYLDDEGQICCVDSADVNRYIREISGQEFTAKDFRTWAGSVLAAQELNEIGPCTSQTDCKKKMVAAVKAVAERLGNRPATCRKYYIHPAIFDGYADGSLFQVMQQGELQEQAYAQLGGLRREEYCVIAILAQHAEKQARQAALIGKAA
jgi:DNA topoisomerase I